MFNTFNTERFGEAMKNLRLAHHLTQREVYELSGINIGTLQRIEKGNSIPKLDTLEILSRVYKTDIIELFLKFRSSKRLIEFYMEFDYWILYNQRSRTETLESKLQELLQVAKDEELLDNNELEQLKMLLQGMKAYESKDYLLSINIFIEAMRLTKPGFSLDTFKNHHYVHLEGRLLLLIAVILGAQRKVDESQAILKMMLDIELDKEGKDMMNINLICKIYYNITMNYHFIDDHDMVIKYANKGIEFAKHFQSSYSIAHFYYRIGIAKHLKKDPDYMVDLKKSMCLLNVFSEVEFRDLICDITLKKYNIDLNSFKLENLSL